jgi:hypothetical protein
VIVREMTDEVLVYDLNTHKAFCLNNTSALIWSALDGQRDIPAISRFVGTQLGAEVSEDLIWLGLDQLQREGLLEEDRSELKMPFDGISRRRMIREIGLASMVALPVIASLIAPSAANAASLQGTGATCSANNQCISNNCKGSKCCAGSASGLPGSPFVCGTPNCCTTNAALVCCSGVGTFVSPNGGGSNCQCS